MMNKQKDIQGHGLISQKNANGMEVFGVSITKKCERLATAIYLVTNFLSDTEPLKSRLRFLSIDFVRSASAVRYGGQATETAVLDTLRGNIGETLSLLELAFIAGLVSEMNFTILKREYRTLRDTIDIKKASRESNTDTILGDTFFGNSFHEESVSPVPAPVASSLRAKRGNPSPAPIQNSKFNIQHSTPNMSDRTHKGPSPVSNLKPNTSNLTPPPVPAPLSTFDFRLSTSAARDSRRARILKLIKDNREVAIKDIVAHFPDVSEKTIQRELVAMSDSNVLKKSGERRWSRYALA